MSSVLVNSSPFNASALAKICGCCGPCSGSPCQFDCKDISQYLTNTEDPANPLTWDWSVYGHPNPVDVSGFCDINVIWLSDPSFTPLSTYCCNGSGVCSETDLRAALNAVVCPVAWFTGGSTFFGSYDTIFNVPANDCEISTITECPGSWTYNGLGDGLSQSPTITLPCPAPCTSGTRNPQIIQKIGVNSYSASCVCVDGSGNVAPDGCPTSCPVGYTKMVQHVIQVEMTCSLIDPFGFSAPQQYADMLVDQTIYTNSWCDEVDFGWIKLKMRSL